MKILLITVLCLVVAAQGYHLHNHNERGNWECLKKYLTELDQINSVLAGDLKQCSLDPSTQSDCTHRAVDKAVEATNEITAKCTDDSATTVTQITAGDTYKKCFEMYAPEFIEVRNNLVADIKACATSDNKSGCIKESLEKAKNTSIEITEKINQCIKDGAVVAPVPTTDSIQNDCLEKYAPEFVEVKTNLVAELELCKSSANQRECVELAVKKATEASVVITEKVYQCIKDGNLRQTPELFRVSGYAECFKKYASEFVEARNKLVAELKSCSSSDDKPNCIKDALTNAKTASLEITDKIMQCVKQDVAFQTYISHPHDSIQTECLKKYAPEFSEIKSAILTDLEACQSSANQKECAEAAVKKATDASYKVTEKVYQCIQDGKFNNRVPEPYRVSDYTECFKKYAPEFAEVKTNLVNEMEACKSSDNQKDCIVDALKKAKDASVEISQKIYKCLAEDDSAQNYDIEDLFSSSFSVHTDCLKKYAPEFEHVQQTFLNDLEECSESSDRLGCVKAAFSKAKSSSIDITQKVLECVKNNNNV